jgi:hypothetical protein
MNLRIGDLVTNLDGRLLGTVTYVRYAAGPIPLALTVCTGPTAFDLIHPNPESVEAA